MNHHSEYNKTKLLRVNNAYIGESLEEQLRRVTENKEPIEMISPIIYTERREGVLPQYDIRTDRFDIACEAMGKVAASHAAKREQRIQKLNGDPNKQPTGTE